MLIKRYSLRPVTASTSLLALFLLLILLSLNAQKTSSAGVEAPGKDARPQGTGQESLPPGLVIETVLTNLNAPMAMAFDNQGRIFFTEKGGAVRVAVGGQLQSAPVKTFNVDPCIERGLLGIALDPNFAANHFVYVYYTEGAGEPCGETSTWNRVVRFVENNGQAVAGSEQVLFNVPQQSGNHVGGNIHFGPDGMLYISVGDNGLPANAQNLSVPNGKLHRINPVDGSAAPGNPVFTQTGALSTIYAYGLRNSFDFTFDPLSGNLFSSENGPSCDDELNRIEAGFNYGWRSLYYCDDNNPDRRYNSIDPLWYLGTGSPDPAECCISPTGVEVYTGTLIPEWTNHLLMCTLKETNVSDYGTANLYHFYLDESRDDLMSPNAFSIVSGVDCSLDIETGPDGALYYFEATNSLVGTLKRIVPAGMATITPPAGTPTRQASPTSTATPSPICEVEFEDVQEGSPFYPYITCLACRQVLGGYPCGDPGEPCDRFHNPYYRPGANITRAQISKIVSEAARFNEPPGDQVYQDVEPNTPFYNYVNRLARRGYIGGYACGGDGEPCGVERRPYFRPNDSVTRGQLSKIVSNAAGFNNPVSGQTYIDVAPAGASSAFYPYIERLSSRRIISGYACGSEEPNSGACDTQKRPYFHPNNPVTRGQAAKILHNTFFPGCVPYGDQVDIVQFDYEPVEIAVRVGTTVQWTNLDLDYHTVTSMSQGGPLDSPNIQQNQSWSYTFNTPGEYTYYCKPHPYMQAKVVVTP